MVRYTVFTHGDMDGYSCQIVLNHLKPEISHYYIVENPNDLKEELENFLTSIDGDDNIIHRVIISDLNINQNIADIIDRYQMSGNKITFQVFDHHLGSISVLKDHPEYDWLIATGDKSGCKIVLDAFLSDIDRSSGQYDQLCDYIRLVDLYDRGIWDDPKVIKLNMLFKSISHPNTFIKLINGKIDLQQSDEFEFSVLDKFLISLQEKFIDNILDDIIKNDSIYSTKILGNKVAVIFLNNRDISVVCKELLVLYPDFDYIINFNLLYMTANLRTLRDDIDLSNIANRYGGGGHKKAAGFPIHKRDVDDLIKNVLGITINKKEKWYE